MVRSKAPSARLDLSFLSPRVQRAEYYFLDLEPRPRAALCVVLGGREVCGAGYSVDRESFRFHSIEYVDSGLGTLELAGRCFRLRPGTLFRYGPDVPHRITADAPMLKYFVDFAGTQAPRLLQTGPWAALRPLRVAEPARVRALFEELQRVGQSPTPLAPRRAGLLLQQLVLAVADEALPEEADESAAWRTYQRCRARLESACFATRSLGEIGAACGVSTAHLCRLFQRYAGVLPHRLLVQLKMARAASLLLDGQRLVKQIGPLVGYDDPYHFSRVFKRVYGLSPEAFRARRRLLSATRG
jgi:AraC-like DNA-binding protein